MCEVSAQPIQKRIRMIHRPFKLYFLFILSCLLLMIFLQINFGSATLVNHLRTTIRKNGAAREEESNARHLKLTKILTEAAKRGIGGGIPGALAGVVQVLTLMWLRTIINYQARYGATFWATLTTLYNDGGVSRFYRGLGFALIQAPLTRFVSTAANDGVETLLAGLETTKDWGPSRTTVVAALVVSLWCVWSTFCL